ncbi:MAG: tetratricopeptide repeat protein, partial [Anaerolineae bacterium]|nr:tetratricopeptide repeat protein [Anaerolineae bacterium]
MARQAAAMTGAESAVAKLIDASIALEHQGDMAAAIKMAQKALKQALAAGEGEKTAVALVQLAFLQFRLGRHDQARDLAGQALTWAAPDSPARCSAWLVLGHCATETHSLDEAETYYRQTADLGRRIGHYAHWARSLHNLANGVYFTRGLFDLALSLEDECAQIIRQHDLGILLRFPLLTIAWVCQVTGQRERARAALDELAHILAPDAAFWGYHAFLSALLALDEGEVNAAYDLLRRALTVAEKTGEPGLNGITRVALSRCMRLSGNAPAARSWADDVANLARRVGY